jgi:type I restriction enzyme S subunit
VNRLVHVPLGDVAKLNPTFKSKVVASDELVDFLPMSTVNADLTTVCATEQRQFSEVQKGYTNFADGDVLLAKITPCFENGKIAFAKLKTEYGFGSTEFHVIRADRERLDGRYLVHFLRRDEIRVDGARNMTGSAGQRRVPKHYLESLSIPLPTLNEQRRIASILDQTDALRAKRREALAQLDSLTQSIFIEMFGDPVANDRVWPFVAVSDFVAGFESGKSIVADDEDESESPFRVLKISAVTSLEYKPEHSKAVPSDYIPPASHIVRKGDLLFSRANTTELIGATAYVNETPDNLLLPDKLWRFVWFEKPRAAPLYVRHLFQQVKFRQEIGQRASGTSGSMQNISQPKVLSIRVGNPPLALQQTFATRIQSVEALKITHKAALQELDRLFASLQHRAFSGEL